MPDADRDSLLTASQRAFLGGETDAEWSDSTGRATRSRIRKRIWTGLQDFEQLADPASFADRDLDQIRQMGTEQTGQMHTALEEMIAFVYRMAPDRFESIIEAGAKRGVKRIRPDYDVGEVQIPIRKRGQTIERARQRMEKDEPLTDTQVRVLLEAGDHSATDIQEYVQSHPTQPTDEYRYRFR